MWCLIIGALSLTTLMGQTFGGLDQGLRFRVFNVTNLDGDRQIYPPLAQSFDLATRTKEQRGASQRRTFSALGESFLLEAVPTEEFLVARRTRLPQYTVAAGIALSVALAALAFAALTRNRRVLRLVAERTAELEKVSGHLRESEMMAMQSEKMSSLGQMVAGVAHEINTPLGFVSSNMQMMAELTRDFLRIADRQIGLLGELKQWPQMDGAARNQWYAQALDQHEKLARERTTGGLADADSIVSDSLVGLERLADLVSTLKNFSRVDRAMIEDIDIHDCIDSTLKIAHNNVKHKADVVRDFEPVPPLKINPSQINQVLLNLINNAAQAIDGFGQITVRTRADREAVRVSVEDSGKGMDEVTLSKIFEPFFTTKAMGEGTGLGLSISQKIAREHGGWLEVSSTLGAGSTFTLVLPLVREVAT
jgi:signal transduction histidine kinase